MSGRKNAHIFKFWDSQDITSTVVSPATNILYLDNMSIQLLVTCTANNGQFSIQVSNDNSNWEDLSLTPSISPLASANTTIFVNLQQVGAAYIRVKFTAGVTHTNGTVIGYLVTKEL